MAPKNRILAMKKATVMGLGYVGLPLSLVLWSRGFEVYGLDVRERYIKDLCEGRVKMAESFNGEPITSVLKGLLPPADTIRQLTRSCFGL